VMLRLTTLLRFHANHFCDYKLLLAFWNGKCTQQFCDSRSVTMCNVPKSRGVSPPERDLAIAGNSVLLARCVWC
jgi:hypothetical protein